MCLAIPGKVVAINDFLADVESFGNVRTVGLTLTPEAQIGDWVLVHAGFIIEIIDEQRAEESLEIWKEMIAYENARGQ